MYVSMTNPLFVYDILYGPAIVMYEYRYGKCNKCGVGEGYGKHATKAAAFPGGKGGTCSDGGKTV